MEALEEMNYEPEDGFEVVGDTVMFDTSFSGLNPVKLLVAIGHLEDRIQTPVDAMVFFADGTILEA